MTQTVVPPAVEPGSSDRKKRVSLIRNFAWMLKGNLIYAACQWLITVCIARLSSPERLGDYALATGIATPVFLLFNLQLRAVQATDSRNAYAFADYLRLRCTTVATACVVIALIAAVRGGLDIAGLVIVLLALSKGVDALADICQGFFQKYERMNWIGSSMALRGSAGAVGVWLAMYATRSLPVAVAGMAFTSFAILFLWDRPHVLQLRGSGGGPADLAPGNPVGGNLVRLASTALPLGFVMGLVSLNVQLPRYFVSGVLGAYELGIFAASAYILAGANTLVDALGQACSPRLSRLYAAGNIADFRNLVLRLAGMSCALGLTAFSVAAVAGRSILGLVYGPEYAARSDAFVWVMAATPVLFSANSLGYAMTAAQSFKAQIPVFLVTTGVTAASCLFLVPRYGAAGAGMALLASASVQWTGSATVLVHACLASIRKRRVEEALVLEAI